MAPCHHRAIDMLQKTTRNGGDTLFSELSEGREQEDSNENIK